MDECGASIYSVSDIAQKEMPDLDPSLRGAGKCYCVIGNFETDDMYIFAVHVILLSYHIMLVEVETLIVFVN